MPTSHYPYPVWQKQADALVNMSGGTPPATGVKYAWSTDGSVANALGTQKNARIISIMTYVAWTVQPTPLEVHVTIDGILHTFFVANPVTITYYYDNAAAGNDEVNQVLGVNPYSYSRAFLEESRSVKVEAEITGGTVQTLFMRVKWAKIP